jgi:hypothetical protein
LSRLELASSTLSRLQENQVRLGLLIVHKTKLLKFNEYTPLKMAPLQLRTSFRSDIAFQSRKGSKGERGPPFNFAVFG